MKKALFLAFAGLVIGLLWTGPGLAKKPTHLDKAENEAGCGGCHSGAGAPGTPLLKKRGEKLCFGCHGSIKTGGPGEASTDMEGVFQKISHHPVPETSNLHRRGEELPETDPSKERHVSCDDCHKAHVIVPEKPWAGVEGLGYGRIKKKNAEFEYELCYLCHSESANRPAETADIMTEFDTMNPSFHPVEARGKNNRVPSLISPLSIASIIKCSDCHGNNEINGPSGPHGSDFSPLLVAEYRTEDGPEGPSDYELCYMCHNRMSILNDASFKAHKEHVVFNDIACRSCHKTHGSLEYPHLIGFNEDIVEPSEVSGGPEYMPDRFGEPKCFLACHMVDHNEDAIGEKPWPW